jgi:nitroreductase
LSNYPTTVGQLQEEIRLVQISPLLTRRRSIRSFQERDVSQQDIEGLLEAARRSPSGGNRQPWRYIVRTGQAERAALGPCLTTGNQWALRAPLLITQVTRREEGGQSNGIPYAYFDCGLSVMCLIVEAEARGLRAHPMAGWRLDPLRETLRIPVGWEPTVVIAVGYEGPLEALPAELQAKEARQRERRPLEAMVAIDVWNPEWSVGDEAAR